MTSFPPFLPLFPHFSPVFFNICPRAVGRGCREGPQRLAGEALLLPCRKDKTYLMSMWRWQSFRSGSALKDDSDVFGVWPIGHFTQRVKSIHLSRQLSLKSLPALKQKADK